MIGAWATAALAGTALDGSSGLVRLPSADTVPMGRLRASFGVEATRGFDGIQFGGLPVGFAGGLADGVEVGGHVDRFAAPGVDGAPPAAAGAYVRIRPWDPVRARPGLALQAGLEGLGREVAGEAAVVGGFERPHLSVAVDVGARLDRGLSAWSGAGVERSWRTWSALVEGELALGGALADAEGRGGVRWLVRDRLGLLAWGGGGVARGSPWAGGGLAVQLSSADPRGQDTDHDTILDWTERCRFEREDLDGFEDTDGCPDPDNDGDSIPDFQDPTPNGEPPPAELDLPGETPTLKQRIKARPPPGPLDPRFRGRSTGDGDGAR